MTGPVLPIEGRCQSRAYIAPDGTLYGVAASMGFGQPLPGPTVEDHAKSAFGRMEDTLAEAGLALSDVCFVQVFLHDVERDVEGFNTIWRSVFDGLSPARICVGATLQAGMLVEMTFVAKGTDA